MAETEEALVARSQKGDRAAFEELVRRTARLVFSRLYLETGDTHQAEDLVQETYLSAWKRLGQVTDASAGGFRTWLLSVAHSVAIDAHRRKNRRKRGGRGWGRVDESALETVEAGGNGPAEEAQQREERERMLGALRSMPEEYRAPLMLRYIAGADYDTIGRELGLSNGSLRGMLSRGMGLLKRELGRMTRSERH